MESGVGMDTDPRKWSCWRVIWGCGSARFRLVWLSCRWAAFRHDLMKRQSNLPFRSHLSLAGDCESPHSQPEHATASELAAQIRLPFNPSEGAGIIRKVGLQLLVAAPVVLLRACVS
jgi:hypothetical protein